MVVTGVGEGVGAGVAVCTTALDMAAALDVTSLLLLIAIGTVGEDEEAMTDAAEADLAADTNVVVVSATAGLATVLLMAGDKDTAGVCDECMREDVVVVLGLRATPLLVGTSAVVVAEVELTDDDGNN